MAWGIFCQLLGTLGHFLANFGAFKNKLFSTMDRRCAPRCLLKQFWLDFAGFGTGLDSFLGGLGESFGVLS